MSVDSLMIQSRLELELEPSVAQQRCPCGPPRTRRPAQGYRENIAAAPRALEVRVSVTVVTVS